MADIVIPVYSGVDETLACIRSVIATTPNDAEIIVIEDASPDPDMTAALASLAADGSITLLHNPRNLGFPATANRGMRLHPDRDIVLLNADTEVYSDWLTRLRNAAYREAHIATVTPLTNSGSIASYPKSEEAVPSPDHAESLDRLAARTNAGISIEVPTAVGFCMYIKRVALNEGGYFDDDLFAKGYGEENDFCLRTAKAGWKHVLAADIYVRHAGSRSFGGRRAALLERNLRLLNGRYPGYEAAIQEYLKRDPAHSARRNLDEVRLADTKAAHVLLVSLGLDGGVFRAVQERMALYRNAGIRPILLTPDPTNHGLCELMVEEPGFDDLQYDFATEAGALEALLKKLPFDHIELHHFLDHPAELIDSLFDLGRPVDIIVHDYIWYCPRITLLDQSSRYCGEPSAEACETCVDKNGSRLKEKIRVAALRQRSARWLGSARSVKVPSPSVAKRMEPHFPDIDFQVEPLESSFPPPVSIIPQASARGPIKIALVGAIGDHKGYKTLLAMAKYAAEQNLPLDFVVIGFTKNDRALLKTGKVFVTGRYEEEEVPGLIERESPDVLLFLSAFPESWCYTLTHALRAQVPVAALDSGAIGDRLRGTAAEDMLFPFSSSAADLCNRLLLAFRPSAMGGSRETNPVSAADRSSAAERRADILSDVPALPETAKSLRTVMAPTSNEPTASVSFLPLNQGLYLFSVRSEHSTRQSGEQPTLPAMQVTAAPGTHPGHIEFMMGGATANGWLTDWNDQIVAKVNGPSVLVSLMSVLMPGMIPLEIEIQRLDQPRNDSAPSVEASPKRELPPLPSTEKSLPLRVIAHVQNQGDMDFSEEQWVGLPGQNLWIESLAISLKEGLSPDLIEYQAITATGVETPWVTGGALCGTRGIGVPITGFALRGKSQAAHPDLNCEYGAVCLSGAVVGPVRNGAVCSSAQANDPITGIWIGISGAAARSAETIVSIPLPSQKPDGQPLVSREQTVLASSLAETPQRTKKPRVGPRFSVFREAAQTENE